MKFKFFDEEEEDYYINLEHVEMASWLWSTEFDLSRSNYTIKVMRTNGIIEFLNTFDANHIVVVVSITGPDNNIHTGNDERPWGFNIQRDPIQVHYLDFINN